MAEFEFEDILPFVEGEGDTGRTAREKINRNFDKIKPIANVGAEMQQLRQDVSDDLEQLHDDVEEMVDKTTSLFGYYTCSIAGDNPAKTVQATGYELTTGGNIRIKMEHANSAASPVTLQIGNAAAKELYYNGESVSPDNTWEDNEVIVVYYDGTKYIATNSLGGGGSEDLDERVEAIEEQLSAPAGTAPTYTILPKLEIEPGVYVKTSHYITSSSPTGGIATEISSNNTNYKYAKFDVHNYIGNDVAIRCKSSGTVDYVFTDSNNGVISTGSITDSNIVVVPANSYYLYTNQYGNTGDNIIPGVAVVDNSSSGGIGYLRDKVDVIDRVLITTSTGEIEVDVIPGKGLTASGGLSNYVEYSVTDFIDVIAGEEYKYTGTLASNFRLAVCGYNDNEEPLCFVLRATSTDYVLDNVSFVIPADVTKIRACGKTNSELKITGSRQSSKLDQLQEEIDNLPSGGQTEKEVYEAIPLGTLGVGFVVKPSESGPTNITVNNNGGYINTDYIPVVPGSKIYVNCKVSGGVLGVQGYTLNGGVYTWVETIVPSGVTYYREEVSVGENTQFIRINSSVTWTTMLWKKKTVPANTVTKKFIHKNVRWVGMSIWAYEFHMLANGMGGNVVARGYQSLLKEQFDFDWDNSTLTSHSGNSLGALQADVDAVNTSGNHTYGSSIILKMYDEYETGAGANYDALSNAIWTLDTITNDFKRNIPIGTTDDYDNNTGFKLAVLPWIAVFDQIYNKLLDAGV